MCASNKYGSQIPHIYHICQLPHVHISDNYVRTYPSYELNVINNMARNIGIYIHSTLLAYAHEEICLPHGTYVQLHLYCSLDKDPTFLHKSIKNQ